MVITACGGSGDSGALKRVAYMLCVCVCVRACLLLCVCVFGCLSVFGVLGVVVVVIGFMAVAAACHGYHRLRWQR